MSTGGQAGAPAGPNMGMLTSIDQNRDGGGGGMSAMGQAQMRPCFWLPNTDFKPVCTPSDMMQWKADKKLLPGADAVKLLPAMVPESIPILGDIIKALWDALQAGGGIQDMAADLQAMGFSEEQIEAIMASRSSGIAEPESGASVNIQALGALRNVAMNSVAPQGADGPALG